MDNLEDAIFNAIAAAAHAAAANNGRDLSDDECKEIEAQVRSQAEFAGMDGEFACYKNVSL